jgi:superfamily I DNA/RNA helicase
MRREGEELLRLTEQQYALLDFLGGHRRAAIDGAAGSGKTLLALEQCRRLARQGFRTLFTCYNKALAAFARETLAADLGEAMALVTVSNYHDLAADFARRAGVTLPPEGSLDAPALAAYFQDELPEALARALDRLPDRFDAVIADEGQDFADTWWLTLEALLADPTDGPFFIFYDENQRIYAARGDYPIPRPHFPLRHNCRTTRRIHEAAMAYHAGAERPDCRGPEGRAIIQTGATPDDEAAALRKTLHELTTVEGVPLDEIVVLTPRSRKTSRLAEGTRVGNATLTWGEGGPNTVRCRSIHTFKGLESPVVILAEPERAHASTRAPLLYVALSRARHHVVVLGHLPSEGHE